MKKLFVSFAVFTALFLMIACGSSTTKIGDEADTGDTMSDEDAADTDPVDSETADTASDSDISGGESDTQQTEEGIYLGIIGFNNDLHIKEISRLTRSNMSEFNDFIDGLESENLTALYYADYKALEMMRDFPVTPELKLQNVAMVTFTDGLDNQSLTFDEFNPGNYESQAEYRNALHKMIIDENGIHGRKVEAYTIGLKGKDVTDNAAFEETLTKLASNCDEDDEDCKYVFQVSEMNEAMDSFAVIADKLYSVSTSINMGVYIPGGYDNGQVIRYTFDDATAAMSSSLYIEGTFRRADGEKILENIIYKGFKKGDTKIVSSSKGPHGELYFQFDNLKYSDGSTVPEDVIKNKSRLWKQTSTGGWDGETEIDMAELPPSVDEHKSSALIMLVLDSTTSLGGDFAMMKQAGKDFVTTLVKGTTQDDPDQEDPDSEDTDDSDPADSGPDE